MSLTSSTSAEEKFEDARRSIFRSESDCRRAIYAVQVSARHTLQRRCLTQIESAWRDHFHASLSAFHYGVAEKFAVWKSQAQQQQKASFQRFVVWADTISEWFDGCWASGEKQRQLIFSHYSIQAQEAFGRKTLVQVQQRDFASTMFGAFKAQCIFHYEAEFHFLLRSSKRMLALFASREHDVVTVNGAKVDMWSAYATFVKRKFEQSFAQLSELELIKYKWSLLFRLEQAGRRRIVWQSILKGCQLMESWERLYILQLYAFQAGAALWFHDEQRVVVLMETESRGRREIVSSQEMRERAEVVGHFMLKEIGLQMRCSLLATKELGQRAHLEGRMIGSTRSILDAARNAKRQILSISSEHSRQVSMLVGSEESARQLLTEYLINHHILLVDHWVAEEQRRMQDRISTHSLVPFNKTYREFDSWEEMARKEKDMLAQDAWDIAYCAPLVPKRGGLELPTFPVAIVATPPRSPQVRRRLAMAETTQSPAALSLVDSPRGSSQPSWTNVSVSSSEYDEEEESLPRSPPPPPFPAHELGLPGNLSLLDELASISSQESAERAFLHKDSLATYFSVLLLGGLPTLEEALRLTIINDSLNVLCGLSLRFSFQAGVQATIDSEVRLRRRIILEEVESLSKLISRQRFQKDMWSDRQRHRRQFLDERVDLFEDFHFTLFYDAAVSIADEEDLLFEELVESFSSGLLRIQIDSHKRSLSPALQRLNEQRERFEAQISDASSQQQALLNSAHHEDSSAIARNDGDGTRANEHWYDEPGIEIDADDLAAVIGSPIQKLGGEAVEDTSTSVVVLYDYDGKAPISSTTSLFSLSSFESLAEQEQIERMSFSREFVERRRLIITEHIQTAEIFFRLSIANDYFETFHTIQQLWITQRPVLLVSLNQNERRLIIEDSEFYHRMQLQEAHDFLQVVLVDKEALREQLTSKQKTLHGDVLFTLFYETAVATAEEEDRVFAELMSYHNKEYNSWMERKRLYFGLKLSDGMLMSIPGVHPESTFYSNSKTKEMYYHLRVADVVEPAKPHIHKNDIILAVQGVQVVTLAAMNQVIKSLRSSLAHFTVLRASDGVVTTVSIRGQYRDNDSRSATPTSTLGSRSQMRF